MTMIQLIPIINKLQDVFNAIGQSPIDLPQIVVIGSQSSGKSSVLESIVGRDFLPRGVGVVTRRPLVLQLYNVSSNGAATSDTVEGEEWGEFLHIPDQKFTDFQEIRREIERETERLTGKNKGISNRSINLRIYSPNVLNLTLVDLPGITKVPVGDQPVNIEEQIAEMCFEFISNPNSIILAVTAANTDLANSDALKMARKIDPEGARTIGVLTKLDLMDQGTDAVEMLQGRIIPLRRGFVGVVCRSQQDIINNISIKDSLKKEGQFFQQHPAYRSISQRMGTPFLSKNLNQILMAHIRDCLPEIKAKISGMILEIDEELQEIGESTSSMSKTELGAVLLNLISKFAINFQNSLEGRYNSTTGVEMNELYGGARINFIFSEIFAKSLMGVNPFDGLSDDDIRTAIRNANGPRPSLFVPEVSFELLSRRQIARLEQPGLQCIDLVFDELQRVTAQCETMELTRFADLRDRVIDVVYAMLRKRLGPTQSTIMNLVQIELAYINTNHPDFIGGSRAVAQLMDRMQHEERDAGRATSRGLQSGVTPKGIPSRSPPPPPSAAPPPVEDGERSFISTVFGRSKRKEKDTIVRLPQVPTTMRQVENPTDRERIETEIIKSLMSSYFDIVRKNFMDLVPKTIMYFLVNFAKDNVQNELVSSLYKEEILSDLLRETDDISSRRATCLEMRTLLRRAMEIVNEVRDFNTFK